MKFDIFSPHQPACAVQINGTSLKFMQLAVKGGETIIQAYSHEPLPKDVMSNDTIINADSLAGLIATGMGRPHYGKVTTNRVAITLPESKSFVRVVQIPSMSEAEVENAILFEAESYVPLPMDQVYFDWRILSDSGKEMSVLLVASPKEAVDSYISVLEKANLKVVHVEVESQSLTRALNTHDAKRTALVVDVDSVKTTLIMIEKGNLQFSSSIPIAGNTFTDAIAQSLGISKVQAENIKKKVGISNTPEYPNIRTLLTPVLKSLADEIHNILQFHYDHSDEPVTKLMLSGGNSKDPSLAEFITEQLKQKNLSIEVAKPWQNLPNLQTNPALSELDALSYTAVIGLAMIVL